MILHWDKLGEICRLWRQLPFSQKTFFFLIYSVVFYSQGSLFISNNSLRMIYWSSARADCCLIKVDGKPQLNDFFFFCNSQCHLVCVAHRFVGAIGKWPLWVYRVDAGLGERAGSVVGLGKRWEILQLNKTKLNWEGVLGIWREESEACYTWIMQCISSWLPKVAHKLHSIAFVMSVDLFTKWSDVYHWLHSKYVCKHGIIVRNTGAEFIQWQLPF